MRMSHNTYEMNNRMLHKKYIIIIISTWSQAVNFGGGVATSCGGSWWWESWSNVGVGGGRVVVVPSINVSDAENPLYSNGGIWYPELNSINMFGPEKINSLRRRGNSIKTKFPFSIEEIWKSINFMMSSKWWWKDDIGNCYHKKIIPYLLLSCPQTVASLSPPGVNPSYTAIKWLSQCLNPNGTGC